MTDFEISIYISTYLKRKCAAWRSQRNRDLIYNLIMKHCNGQDFNYTDMNNYLDSKIWVCGENVHLNKETKNGENR